MSPFTLFNRRVRYVASHPESDYMNVLYQKPLVESPKKEWCAWVVFGCLVGALAILLGTLLFQRLSAWSR